MGEVYRFGSFTLAVARRELARDGVALPIGGRGFDILLALVSAEGALVTKGALMQAAWPNMAVEEGNITTQILTLRKLLGDRGDRRMILTVAGRGYRFVEPVVVDQAPGLGVLPVTPATAAASHHRHNLPNEPSSFVGRTTELADIRALLAERRHVTLVGSGGIGKTRTALRIATEQLDAYPDGVWLIELAPLADPGLVAEAVCRALGAPVSGERPAVSVAVSFLRPQSCLLILDNCEHLLAAAAELAQAVLEHCPNVVVLATSRQPLGVGGESVYRVPSMAVPAASAGVTAAQAMQYDSVRLFAERAADIGGYVLTDADAPSVAEICRHLDGVAMATELAAARLRVLKPSEIASRLEDVFRLLTGGKKTALPRQQTLRATIDWSFQLLLPAEQALLRRLSVFVDGFSLAGAHAVGGTEFDEFEIMDLLAALVEKSLLSADMTGAATRYRMLETTRHFATEKLTESGETGVVARMAEYLAAHYLEAERTWPTAKTHSWCATYSPDIENLRAAIAWGFGAFGDPALGVRLVSRAGAIAGEMSLQADVRRWTRTALSHVDAGTPAHEEAWLLYCATKWDGVFGAGDSRERQRMIALFRQSGDAVGLSCALRATAMASARPGAVTAAQFAMVEEAIELLRPHGMTKDLATALGHLGSLHLFNDDLEGARRLGDEALAMRVALDDRTGCLASFTNSAELLYLQGATGEAIAQTERAVATARQIGALGSLANLLCNLAGYKLSIDNIAGAVAAASEALPLIRALDHTDWAMPCLEHLALAAALRGDLAAAARLFGYTDAYYRRTDQVRDRPEQIASVRLRALLVPGLSATELAICTAEGEGWSASLADMAALGLMSVSFTETKVEMAAAV